MEGFRRAVAQVARGVVVMGVVAGSTLVGGAASADVVPEASPKYLWSVLGALPAQGVCEVRGRNDAGTVLASVGPKGTVPSKASLVALRTSGMVTLPRPAGTIVRNVFVNASNEVVATLTKPGWVWNGPSSVARWNAQGELVSVINPQGTNQGRGFEAVGITSKGDALVQRNDNGKTAFSTWIWGRSGSFTAVGYTYDAQFVTPTFLGEDGSFVVRIANSVGARGRYYRPAPTGTPVALGDSPFWVDARSADGRIVAGTDGWLDVDTDEWIPMSQSAKGLSTPGTPLLKSRQLVLVRDVNNSGTVLAQERSFDGRGAMLVIANQQATDVLKVLSNPQPGSTVELSWFFDTAGRIPAVQKAKDGTCRIGVVAPQR